MGEDLYRAWKRDGIVKALARERLAIEVGTLVDAHGEGRRRATFHARFPHGAPEEIGFMRARSHDIIAIDDCPLFSPAMSGAIAAARALASDLRGLGKPLDIGVTASDAGLDIDIRGSGPLDLSATRKLIATAGMLDLARVSNHSAVVIERRSPTIAIGASRLILSPGGFLQATAKGETLLADIAIQAMRGAKRVADLFCGAGAFALRLASKREVVAIDSDAGAIEALRRAAAHDANLRGLRVDRRDLFARPLQASELASFDAALFDPPRAGAQAQARAFAASALTLVVAVSCNAETFARDARILVDGGFAAEAAIPLDQFRFSPHVEIVAIFRRPPARKRTRSILG
jgi:23S rRNA (uracil1939-C5)-methyltransferase